MDHLDNATHSFARSVAVVRASKRLSLAAAMDGRVLLAQRAALGAQKAERPHRVVATAASWEGLFAPVAAGEAITVSIGGKLPAGLRIVADDEGACPRCRISVSRSSKVEGPFSR